MRKLILFLLIILACTLPPPADAQGLGPMGPGPGCKGYAVSKYCDTKSGYIYCEDFEGATSCESGSANSNCRNTFAAGTACTTAPNYGYSTSPLAGTYSAYFNELTGGDGCTKAFDSTSRSAWYSYFRMKIGALSQTSGNFANIFGSTARCVLIVGNNGGNMMFGVATSAGTTYCSSGCTTPTQGNEYHVWLEFQQNVADSGCKLYVSTTTTKPASPEVQATTTNFAATGIFYGSRDFTNNVCDQIQLDNILIDDSAIGDE